LNQEEKNQVYTKFVIVQKDWVLILIRKESSRQAKF